MPHAQYDDAMDRLSDVERAAVAALSFQSIRLGHAVLLGEFDLARTHLDTITSSTQSPGLFKVWLCACAVKAHLGPAGGLPLAGYGEALLRLACQLDRHLRGWAAGHSAEPSA
ncbi:hypothetical protein VI08_09030 [Luteibacter yeojuensis]|uniref:Uncharacterized protein n=1 Tax=Luteibacter yeojuensis TaxID=345309 RepID=A0A0F3KUV6_9GAMM|nr:hypothetical protein VI08_09030 [Luteibacter yeojuensis]